MRIFQFIANSVGRRETPVNRSVPQMLDSEEPVEDCHGFSAWIDVRIRNSEF